MGIFTAKNAGKAFTIVGVLTFIGGILTIVAPFLHLEGLDDYEDVYFYILAVGELTSGALYFVYGRKVTGGQIVKMVDVLSYFSRVIGVAAIVSGVCSTAAAMYPSLDIGTFFAGAISSIVVGLILIILSTRVNDGRKEFIDKVIWTILLIAFMVLFLVSLMEVIGVDNVIAGAIGVLTYVFMIIILFDPEVEVAMGIREELIEGKEKNQ